MKITVEKILEKILLPVSKGWEISGVCVDEQKHEIYIDLVYTSRSVFVDVLKHFSYGNYLNFKYYFTPFFVRFVAL